MYMFSYLVCFTLVNSPKKSQVANDQKNRSVIRRNSRTQKVILGHRICKVQDNTVLKEKGLIKCNARGHIGHKAREAQ